MQENFEVQLGVGAVNWSCDNVLRLPPVDVVTMVSSSEAGFCLGEKMTMPWATIHIRTKGSDEGNRAVCGASGDGGTFLNSAGEGSRLRMGTGFFVERDGLWSEVVGVGGRLGSLDELVFCSSWVRGITLTLHRRGDSSGCLFALRGQNLILRFVFVSLVMVDETEQTVN